MKTFRIIGFALIAILLCLSACSGGDDPIDPIQPTPQPEVVKSEITIDSSIITKGLIFTNEKDEQSITFSTNENWTLSVASTTSGATWCTASSTSGSKGTANVKFTVSENTDYDNRSVSVTIKSGTATKTFTISQKGADALLVTTDKYEVSQEGGIIDIEVKANIKYQMEISEDAKSWITESSGRGLTTYKHSLNIAMNEEGEKREGEVYFKSGDKVETVKIYQAGGAILLLSENEYHVSDKGDTISVDIRSNIEFGVQMPDVDWIVDEASSRGLSSHTLKYVVKANEGYDARTASIVFYDKNSELKDTLVVNQAQKDAIVVSEKNISVAKEGGIVEVKVASNVDFEVQIPTDATWVTQTDSRALIEKSVYLKIAENKGEESRNATITFTNKESQINESITISQAGAVKAGYAEGIVTLAEAGTMKKLLGKDYLNITSLKVVGSINGDDVYYLRKMLGASSFSEGDWGKLTTLDLSKATIVEGGDWYYEDSYSTKYNTSNDEIGDYMFNSCKNLKSIVLPVGVSSIGDDAFFSCSSLTSLTISDGVTSIGREAFYDCCSLKSIKIPVGVTSIGESAFERCSSLTSIDIPASVTSICSRTFTNCKSLITVIMVEGVTSIGNGTFMNCSLLTSVKIPASVTSIGGHAFYNCSSLTSIDIPAGVTSIGESAFERCSSLTSIDIPANVTSICSRTFNGCKSLISVTMGAGVTSIGQDAFENCSSLNDLYCYAATPPTLSKSYFQIFPYYEESTTLHVPARCGTKYKSSKWANYFKTIKEMD